MTEPRPSALDEQPPEEALEERPPDWRRARRAPTARQATARSSRTCSPGRPRSPSRAPLARGPGEGTGATVAVSRSRLHRGRRLHRPRQLRHQHRRRRQVRLHAALGGARGQSDRDGRATQSAKLGIATGRDLSEVCRGVFSRKTSIGPWIEAEVVAMSTDIAEVVGAALGLNLLFGIPLFTAALIAGAGAFAILALQQRGFRRLEAVIASMVGVVLLASASRSSTRAQTGQSSPTACWCRGSATPEHPARHRDHRRDGDAPRDLSALVADPAAGGGEERWRAAPDPPLRAHRRGDRDGARRCGQPLDDDHGGRALPWSGLVGIDSIEGAYDGLQTLVSHNAATVFGVALLASGFASSSVGTMAGQVVMQGHR